MYQSSKRNNQFLHLIDDNNNTGDISSDDEKQVVVQNSSSNVKRGKSPKSTGGAPSAGASGLAVGAGGGAHQIFEHFKNQNQPSHHSSSSSLQQHQQHPQPDNSAVNSVPSIIPNKPPPVGEGENPLETAYTFWFTQRGRGAKNKSNTAGDFEQNIRYVASVSSVEQFWQVYTYLIQPHELNGRCDIHLFRHGIRPMWEDENNKEGGKWIVRLRKGFATRCWENLILAMLGEQFMVGREICGAVISVRYHTEDIVSIWNRNAHNMGVINQIRDIMKRVLNLPNNTIMEYKEHRESIKDASSRQLQQQHSHHQQQGGGAGAGQPNPHQNSIHNSPPQQHHSAFMNNGYD